MNKIEYERTRIKLELFEQKGLYWLLDDLQNIIKEEQIELIDEHDILYNDMMNIAERVKNEYEKSIIEYEKQQNPNILEQTKLGFT